MLARSEVYIKWTLYALSGLLCWFVQGSILQRVCICGVIPFLYPLPGAMLGVLEGPFRGTVYALAAGFLCDQFLPTPIPCLYTLIFPLTGLLSGLFAGSGLKAGILCGILCGALSVALTGGFELLIFWLQGKQNLWPAAGLVIGKETALSTPFAIPVYALFWLVHRHVHRWD